MQGETNMKKILLIGLMTMVFAFLSACGGSGTEGTNTGGNANENANAAKPAEDASSTVIDLEKKAHEAWKAKDGKFFEGMLADNFKGVVGDAVVDKAALVKQISDSKCEVKSFELTDPKTVKISDNAMLVTHKLSYDYTCDGKTVKSPEYVASVYVKDGDNWKGAFHMSELASDAKGDIETLPDSSVLKETNDDTTNALAKVDKAAWDAWAKGDAKWFENNLAPDIIVASPGGFQTRDELVKAIPEMKCEVDQYGTQSFSATTLTENVYLLMYKGTQKGKCGGQELPPVVIGASVTVKNGDKWDQAFHMETAAK